MTCGAAYRAIKQPANGLTGEKCREKRPHRVGNRAASVNAGWLDGCPENAANRMSNWEDSAGYRDAAASGQSQ